MSTLSMVFSQMKDTLRFKKDYVVVTKDVLRNEVRKDFFDVNKTLLKRETYLGDSFAKIVYYNNDFKTEEINYIIKCDTLMEPFGNYVFYYPNELIMKKGKYDMGIKVGIWICFDIKGNKRYSIDYLTNKLTIYLDNRIVEEMNENIDDKIKSLDQNLYQEMAEELGLESYGW